MGVFYFGRGCPAIDCSLVGRRREEIQSSKFNNSRHLAWNSPTTTITEPNIPHAGRNATPVSYPFLGRIQAIDPGPASDTTTKSWSTQPPSWTFLIRRTEEDAARKGGWRGRHSAGAGSRGRCSLLLQAVVGSVPVAWVSVEGARTHGLRGGGGVIYFLSWDGRGGKYEESMRTGVLPVGTGELWLVSGVMIGLL